MTARTVTTHHAFLDRLIFHQTWITFLRLLPSIRLLQYFLFPCWDGHEGSRICRCGWRRILCRLGRRGQLLPGSQKELCHPLSCWLCFQIGCHLPCHHIGCLCERPPLCLCRHLCQINNILLLRGCRMWECYISDFKFWHGDDSLWKLWDLTYRQQ